MAEFNKNRFLLCVTLMICSSNALELALTNANGSFSYYTPIVLDQAGGYSRRYLVDTFMTPPETSKVVVYVCNFQFFNNIQKAKNINDKRAIAAKFRRRNQDLLFLGVQKPKKHDLKHIVGEFILETIKILSGNLCSIEILAEDRYLMQYESSHYSIPIYNEDPDGSLLHRLNAMATK